MKRLVKLVAPVLAAGLLVACGSNDPATVTNTAASTTGTTTSSSAATTSSSSATSTTSVAASSSSSEEETTDEEITDEESSSVEPADLDGDTEAWFNGFCTSLGGILTAMGPAMEAGMGMATATGPDAPSPADMQATQVSAFQALGDALNQAAEDIAALDPPGFDGGAEVSVQIAGAFATIGDAYSQAGSDLAAADVTDQASLEAALEDVQAQVDEVDQGLSEAFGEFETLFPAGVLEAAESLPACAILNAAG